MTLVRETGSEIITQFAVPSRGTWKNVGAHLLPVDAVYDSLNVYIREGRLRARPGLVRYDETIFTNPILGGAMAVTVGEKVVLAITKDKIYQLSDLTNTWNSLSAPSMTTFAPDDSCVIDIAFMETSGENIAIIAEPHNVLKKWVDVPRSVSILTGTNIPQAKSVCIAASRVIALIYPHTVVWSNINNPTVFDATAYSKRAQSGDGGVLVESLSNLSFVLYKERSIYIVRAQAGLDESTAFSFSEPLYADGPAGVYALVRIEGAHIYMTHNGRIAIFDGTRYPQYIADGLWFFLQEDINPSLAHTIRAVYDYRLHTVTFYYPKINSGSGLRGMVVLNLPFQGQDIQETQARAAFLGVCGKGITHGIEKRWDRQGSVDRSILFSTQNDPTDRNRAYLFNETVTSDDGNAFNCSFQTGLQPMPDARHTHVSTETFVERSQGYGILGVEPVISDMLETPGGMIPDMSKQYINLEQNPVREYIAFGQQVRFFGLRYSWESTSTVRYSGAVVYSSQNQKYRK